MSEVIQFSTVIRFSIELLCLQGWFEDNCCDLEDWNWDPVPEYLVSYPEFNITRFRFNLTQFLRDVYPS
jgi:hypothetical protein